MGSQSRPLRKDRFSWTAPAWAFFDATPLVEPLDLELSGDRRRRFGAPGAEGRHAQCSLAARIVSVHARDVGAAEAEEVARELLGDGGGQHGGQEDWDAKESLEEAQGLLEEPLVWEKSRRGEARERAEVELTRASAGRRASRRAKAGERSAGDRGRALRRREFRREACPRPRANAVRALRRGVLRDRERRCDARDEKRGEEDGGGAASWGAGEEPERHCFKGSRTRRREVRKISLELIESRRSGGEAFLEALECEVRAHGVGHRRSLDFRETLLNKARHGDELEMVRDRRRRCRCREEVPFVPRDPGVQ